MLKWQSGILGKQCTAKRSDACLLLIFLSTTRCRICHVLLSWMKKAGAQRQSGMRPSVNISVKHAELSMHTAAGDMQSVADAVEYLHTGASMGKVVVQLAEDLPPGAVSKM